MGVTEFVTQNDEVGDDKALGKLPMGSDLGAHLKMVKVPAGITFKWKALGQRTETNFDQLSLPAYKVVTRIESTALERLGRFLRSLRTRLFSTFRHGFHCQLLASTWGRVPYGGVEIDGDGNVCALGGSLFLLGLDRPFFARRGKVWYFLPGDSTWEANAPWRTQNPDTLQGMHYADPRTVENGAKFTLRFWANEMPTRGPDENAYVKAKMGHKRGQVKEIPPPSCPIRIPGAALMQHVAQVESV